MVFSNLQTEFSNIYGNVESEPFPGADSVFYSILLNAVGDGILGLDTGGSILYANHAALDLLGYRAEDLIGQDISFIIKNRDDYAPLHEPALMGDIVATDENILRHKDGSGIHAIITSLPVRRGKSTPGVFIVFRDITPSVLLNRSLQEREEILRGVFNMLPAGIMLRRGDGTIARINRAAMDLLGLDGDDWRGRDFPAEKWNAQDMEGRDIPYEDAPFNRLIRDGQSIDNEIYKLNTADGGRYLLVSSNMLVVDTEADAENPAKLNLMCLTTFTDVDRQVRTAGKLETTLSLNSEINDLLRKLLVKQGSRKTLGTALQGVARLTKADRAVIGLYKPETGKIHYKHFHGFDPPPDDFIAPLEASPAGRIFNTREPLALDEYSEFENHIKAFAERGVRAYLAAPIMGETEFLGIIALFRNQKKPFGEEEKNTLLSLVPVLSASVIKARYESELSRLATRDSLTGLWNRRVGFERLGHEIDRCNRYDTHFSSLLMDLDHFKEINDTHGHLVGDEILRNVARVLSGTGRDTDTAARTGGEEFLLILPETDREQARRKAERIRADIENMRVRYRDLELGCTISIGCAEYEKGETEEDFYARLDRLLYRSKHEGRNRISS